MDYRTIQLDAITIVGIERRTTNQGRKAQTDIPLVWDRFYKENILERIPHRKNDAIVGLYTDYEKDFNFPYTFVAGCEVSKAEVLPYGLVRKQLPASHYAIFKAQGVFPESLIYTWEKIWSLPLKRTYTGDFEKYEASFFAAPDNPSLDVYIAIEHF